MRFLKKNSFLYLGSKMTRPACGRNERLWGTVKQADLPSSLEISSRFRQFSRLKRPQLWHIWGEKLGWRWPTNQGSIMHLAFNKLNLRLGGPWMNGSMKREASFDTHIDSSTQSYFGEKPWEAASVLKLQLRMALLSPQCKTANAPIRWSCQ